MNARQEDERQELETDDPTALVIRGLVFFANELNERLVQEFSIAKPAARSVGAVGAIGAIKAICFRYPRQWDRSIENVVLVTKKSACDVEADLDLNQITSRRVGKVLAKLRAAACLAPTKQDPGGGG
jgi:hypothetical protein